MLHHACLFLGLPVHTSPLAPRTSGWRRSPAPVAPAVRTPRFDRLLPVTVDLPVEIARIELTYTQLEQLQIGDEIPIGTLTEARALANGQLAFIGEPGTTGSTRSFRVTKKILDAGR